MFRITTPFFMHFECMKNGVVDACGNNGRPRGCRIRKTAKKVRLVSVWPGLFPHGKSTGTTARRSPHPLPASTSGPSAGRHARRHGVSHRARCWEVFVPPTTHQVAEHGRYADATELSQAWTWPRGNSCVARNPACLRENAYRQRLTGLTHSSALIGARS